MLKIKNVLFILASLLMFGVNNSYADNGKDPSGIPAPLGFTATISLENENNVELNWSQYFSSNESDYISYQIYRDSVLIASTEDTVFVDQNILVGGSRYYTVTTIVNGNLDDESVFSARSYVHLKYPLIVKANNISRYVGFSNPSASGQYTITGYVGNDNINYLSKRPVAFIDPFIYDLALPIGVYDDAVVISSEAEDISGKYRFMYKNGSLTVSNLSDNNTLSTISINGDNQTAVPSYYVINCENRADEVQIIVNPSHSYATVQLVSNTHTAHISGKTITVKADKASTQEVIFVIVAQNGTVSSEYRIIIERYLSFEDIVDNKWGRVLTVINNPIYNGGYKFLAYKWYRNGELVSTTQIYSTPEGDTDTNEYYVEVTTDEGEVFRTCSSTITLIGDAVKVKVYPNPLAPGETASIDLSGINEELWIGGIIEVYNMMGLKIKEIKVKGEQTPVPFDSSSGTYILKLRGNNGFSKDLKVIKK